jgi:hypothetical protein
MDIPAAELTADHVGRTVKIDPGDQRSSSVAWCECPAQTVGHAGTPETETRLELDGPGDQRIRMGFNSIGVVELL